MTAQVGIQKKDWDKSGTFPKARIIRGFDLEPTNIISLPAITFTVWLILRDSEAIKRQIANILPVAAHSKY